MTRKPILIMAGGTGGHVFPALAVADYLHALGIPLLWLGTRRGLEARVVPEAGYPLLIIDIKGIRRKGLIALIIAPLQILRALLQALLILARKRPAAVLGMGGFVSGPGGIAAWLMRIPVLIHEQNAIAGVTNRWLSRIATRVMQGFPDTFPPNRLAIHTGNPIRQSLVEIAPPRERVREPGSQMHVLVLGGSQGARALNQIVPAALSRLSRLAIEVYHQCGENEVDATRSRYMGGNKITVTPFFEDMARTYAWADLVICRSGASTVSELAAVGVAAILVPYPYSVDDHQTMNARHLVDAGAAFLLPERDLDDAHLANLVEELYTDREHLVDMAEQARGLAITDAARRVGDLCLEVAYERR